MKMHTNKRSNCRILTVVVRGLWTPKASPSGGWPQKASIPITDQGRMQTREEQDNLVDVTDLYFGLAWLDHL